MRVCKGCVLREANAWRKEEQQYVVLERAQAASLDRSNTRKSGRGRNRDLNTTIYLNDGWSQCAWDH